MSSAIEGILQGDDLDKVLMELFENYEAENARIDQEIDRLDKKQRELLEAATAVSQEEVDSLYRVRMRQVDDFRAEGKAEEADRVLQSAEEARAVPERLEDAYAESRRQEAILERERKDVARKTLDEWAPGIVELVRGEERKLFAMLDKIEAQITEFVELTGHTPEFGAPGGIDVSEYTNKLVPREGDGEDYTALRKWFLIVEQNYLWRRR